MTCYGALTNCIHLENFNGNDYNVVIGGQRLDLLQHVDPLLKTLLNKCWQKNPLEKLIDNIIECMKEMYSSLYEAWHR